MEIADRVIPGEDNGEEDLSRCDPSYLPCPALRLSTGHWLMRWKLSPAELAIVSKTGDIYLYLGATDGDELISAHRLFVERPDLPALKASLDSRATNRK
jgi:hypothetical protein